MTRDIPRHEWAEFLESFTMQHDQWLVSVASETDPLPPITDQPLEGVLARTENGRDEVIITVGGSTGEHKRITVEAPLRLAVETENGVEQALMIEDASGTVTHLRLTAPIAPELVDGMP